MMCGCSRKFAAITKRFAASSAKAKYRTVWRTRLPASSTPNVHNRQDRNRRNRLVVPGRRSKVRREQQIIDLADHLRSLHSTNNFVAQNLARGTEVDLHRNWFIGIRNSTRHQWSQGRI